MSLKLEDVKEEDRGILAPCGIVCLGCDIYIGEGLEAAKKLKSIWEGGNMKDTSIAIGLNPKEINVTLETINKFIKASDKGKCPGCSKGGFPSQFCGIAKCVKSKGYWTCAECDDYDPSAETPCPNEDPNPMPMANKAQMTKMICTRYSRDTCNNLIRCREIGYDAFIEEAKEKVENGWRTWKVISDEMVFTEAMKK
ncbi:MAG: DUF3795 domain-containing protein [Candidatus Lokiarchaeota archaeon]|nr:DUF3795 domain-containing protein [Candidatus Lokiarchaeota archaeon]